MILRLAVYAGAEGPLDQALPALLGILPIPCGMGTSPRRAAANSSPIVAPCLRLVRATLRRWPPCKDSSRKSSAKMNTEYNVHLFICEMIHREDSIVSKDAEKTAVQPTTCSAEGLTLSFSQRR